MAGVVYRGPKQPFYQRSLRLLYPDANHYPGPRSTTPIAHTRESLHLFTIRIVACNRRNRDDHSHRHNSASKTIENVEEVNLAARNSWPRAGSQSCNASQNYYPPDPSVVWLESRYERKKGANRGLLSGDRFDSSSFAQLFEETVELCFAGFGSVKSSVVRGLDLLSSTPGITVGVGFPFIASPASPCASIRMGGQERANLTRPRRDKLTAATMSRSITVRQLLHQSLRFSRLSDWSLSPHLGQVVLEPLVSRLDRRITCRPVHRALYSICR